MMSKKAMASPPSALYARLSTVPTRRRTRLTLPPSAIKPKRYTTEPTASSSLAAGAAPAGPK